MDDVISLPTRPQIVERYMVVKTYGTFGRMFVTLARIIATEPAPLALVPDWLPEVVGFEILGRVHDTPEGIAPADHVAHAVTMALMQRLRGLCSLALGSSCSTQRATNRSLGSPMTRKSALP